MAGFGLGLRATGRRHRVEPFGPVETAFAYSGATEEFTVPAGATALEFRLWGGGGNGGVYSANAVHGGAGGYTTGRIRVNAGDTVRVQVAQGGQPPVTLPAVAGGAGGWPDGGSGSYGDTWGGGGGGSSRLWLNGALVAVAGGGGGGGGYPSGGDAGAGGGATGQASATGTGGTGGSQNAGGVDASDSGTAAKHGLQLTDETGRTGGWGGSTGDATTSTTDDGGGGGGGYWGGGGGGGDAQAGGGGSGYLAPETYLAATETGNRQTPPGTSDVAYPGAPVAEGSASEASLDGTPAGDGHVWTRLT